MSAAGAPFPAASGLVDSMVSSYLSSFFGISRRNCDGEICKHALAHKNQPSSLVFERPTLNFVERPTLDFARSVDRLRDPLSTLRDLWTEESHDRQASPVLLSSEYGTHETVEVRLWIKLSDNSP